MQINKSIILITGANRGIGRAFVEAALKSGAPKIYAAARNLDSLKDVMAMDKDRVHVLQIDVTNPEQIQAAAEAAQDVQIVINNAGIAEWSAIIASEDISSARREMEVNYFGLLQMSRAFAPILSKNGGGALVNISSIGGLVGIPAIGTYCATKAAVHSLTQSVRGELAAQGTLVVGVYPGPVDTDMAAGGDFEKELPAVVAQAVLEGIDRGDEYIYPDKTAKEVAQGLKNNVKAVEKQWASVLPQTAPKN